MARGRKPIPTAILKLRGSPKGNRPGEPQPKIEGCEPPEHLNANAKAEWQRVMPLLVELGLMSQLTRTRRVSYCATYALGRGRKETR